MKPKIDAQTLQQFQIDEGNKHLHQMDYNDAEVCFKKALRLKPVAGAYENLASIRRRTGDPEGAIHYYKKALKLSQHPELIQKSIASVFSESKEYKKASRVLRAVLKEKPQDLSTIEMLIDNALHASNFREASEYAALYANLVYGAQNQNDHKNDEIIQVSPARLKHDLDQLLYLKDQGVTFKHLDRLIADYDSVLKSMTSPEYEKTALTATQSSLIRPAYQRILFRPHTPRVPRALADEWNIATAPDDHMTAEEDYMQSQLGITVIDNFLSEEALAGLRKFCLESTIWFKDRYAYGRLGAFFREGFNCPLLIQIAEEIKAAFPTIIGEKHTLLQYWAFKFGHFQPATYPHADFSAVNVNFWITPDEANLDESSGGMVIYDVEAPLNWDFDSFNNNGEKIVDYLEEKNAEAYVIPYKGNRALIFNSDLFHGTSPVQFKDSYDSRRINVTLLFGERKDEVLKS
jgi:tetratricopeptide (TPR) repeat protein